VQATGAAAGTADRFPVPMTAALQRSPPSPRLHPPTNPPPRYVARSATIEEEERNFAGRGRDSCRPGGAGEGRSSASPDPPRQTRRAPHRRTGPLYAGRGVKLLKVRARSSRHALSPVHRRVPPTSRIQHRNRGGGPRPPGHILAHMRPKRSPRIAGKRIEGQAAFVGRRRHEVGRPVQAVECRIEGVHGLLICDLPDEEITRPTTRCTWTRAVGGASTGPVEEMRPSRHIPRVNGESDESNLLAIQPADLVPEAVEVRLTAAVGQGDPGRSGLKEFSVEEHGNEDDWRGTRERSVYPYPRKS